MAKAATNQAAIESQLIGLIAVEPLRLDGVDIAPGDPFSANKKTADSLIADNAASLAE